MNPIIEIRDLGNVYVDGVNVGQPADAIANNPALASGIQVALTEYWAQLDAARVAAANEAQSVASDLAAAQARIVELEAQVVALTPEPQTPPEEPPVPPV